VSLPEVLDRAAVGRGASGRMSRRLTEPFAAGGDVLHLTLGPVAGSPEAADVAAYDFAEHQARFGRTPTPSYVVRPLRDLDQDVRVTVRVTDAALPGGGADALVTFGAGTLAGESQPVELAAGTHATARVTRITVARRTGRGFVAAPGPADQEWTVSALLGTTARLLWVLGGERDLIRRQIAGTATQRQLATAAGASLDLIGVDLGVPRFPPLAHSVDDDTIALYHLDDAPGAAAVEDFTGRFPNRQGHNGVLSGTATLGAPGRFGPAVAFAGPGAVTVATDPVFNLPAAASLTAECFVRTEAEIPDARVLARRGATGRGWSIEIGEFGRGLARAVRATVSDGTNQLVLHSDGSLPVDRFTHLALVVDRAEGAVSLWVDGQRADVQDGTALGALTAAVPLVIGPGNGTLRAVVDEVRISRTARAGFAPVLGEGDEHYRRRLRIFRHWVLPTPSGLAAVLNGAVGSIGGVADPLVVDDTDAPMVRGHLVVRVVPKELAPGKSIDALGNRDATEEQLFGDGDDRRIDPLLLLWHDRPEVDYGPAATGDPHLMQPPLARALDRLLALLASVTPGRLRVTSAWTPGAPDARAAGRGLTLTHPTLLAPRLGALAHRAGFALVTTLPQGSGVFAACAPGEPVALVVPGAGVGSDDPFVEVGGTVTLAASPAPPAGAELHWTVAAGGPGRVQVTPATGGTATVQGLDPGLAVVILDLTFGGFSATASTAVRVIPVTVAAGSSIAADGTLGAGPEVAGEPDAQFDPALLVTVNDPRPQFVAANARRMQRGVASRLTALLDDLPAGPGRLSVISALVPVPPGSPPTLAAQGRALVLQHSNLGADRLAALAHIVGFSRVAVVGATVEVLHRAEDLIAVTGPALVEEGAEISLQVEPDPSTVSPTTRLTWSSGPLPPTSGQADLTTTSLPVVRLVGRRAGWVWVQATFREAGANGPYSMQVRLRGGVPAGATITRDQYDLIMNAVHALHPLGVEVLTRSIRPAVVELAGSPNIDADHTFPKFRLHRSAPRLRKDAAHG
jgi:hypothetical protein